MDGEPPKGTGVLDALSLWLNEAVMGFLALTALGFALVPELFSVGAGVGLFIEIGEWIIVALFAAEYLVNLCRAPDRRAYVLGAWRILDLVTIVAPLVSLIPAVSDSLRSSPVLRLLRLFRAVMFGTRAGGSLSRDSRPPDSAPEAIPLRAAFLRGPGSSPPRESTWVDFLGWAGGRGEGWYHVTGLNPERRAELAGVEGIPRTTFEEAFSEIERPRFESSRDYTLLSIPIPALRKEGRVSIERRRTLLVIRASSLVTLSRRPLEILPFVEEYAGKVDLSGAPLPARTVYELLFGVLARNEEALERIEGKIRSLETVPARQSTNAFFEETFHLEKELSSVRADLWRLRPVLIDLREGRESLPGGRPEDRDFLKRLAEEGEDLLQTARELREAVVSIIDLHMNVASFEMNKVMRLLAVVSVLGMIPAVVMGLLGMNVEGSPWPLTLPQVCFGVSMGMLLCLYAFLAKGWIR
jgi:Mg2+ and Co2+ transporter CorA